MKFVFPKISSIIRRRYVTSISSIETKITPSSANSFCSSFKRGYIMHSHLSWRVKSSPSLPTTSPSHFLILESPHGQVHRQAIRFPFSVKQPRCKAETEATIQEVRDIITGEEQANRFSSFQALFSNIEREGGN